MRQSGVSNRTVPKENLTNQEKSNFSYKFQTEKHSLRSTQVEQSDLRASSVPKADVKQSEKKEEPVLSHFQAKCDPAKCDKFENRKSSKTYQTIYCGSCVEPNRKYCYIFRLIEFVRSHL